MDNWIIKEGDTLGCTNGHKPLLVKAITATHVTCAVRGEDNSEHTVTRARFEYALWYGSFFLLEHAS
jgi:hypothetical protein